MIRSKGRKAKFRRYDDFYKNIEPGTNKRPKYIDGIGIFKGQKKETAYVKIVLQHSTQYRGKHYSPGSSLEIKLGNFQSFTWEQLLATHADLQGKADRGEAIEEERVQTFEEYALYWLELKRHKIRTFKTTYAHIHNDFVPEWGQKPLDQITPQMINRWSAKALMTGKPSSVKRKLNTINSLFNNAIREGLLERNPVKNADPIKNIKPRQRVLSDEELVALINKAKEINNEFANYLLWLVHSGMRKMEALTLTYAQVHKLPNDQRYVLLENTKSNKARRIPCSDTMITILDAKNNQFPLMKVFQLSERNMKRYLAKLKIQTGITDFCLHDFRRTHATRGAAAGIDLNTLAKRLGHSDLKMLSEIYAVVQDNTAINAAHQIGNALDQLMQR